MLYSRMADSTANTFIGGGFVGRCQGENNRISADSAEQFEAAGLVNMYGNVVYEEPGEMRITAAHATYFTREGRIFADGNVVATQLATGSTFTGPNIEYYRVMPGRPTARMVAPNRPTARLIEKDSAGIPGPPVTITADRFEDLGDTLLLAWGDVVITREKLLGRADSSAFNKTTQQARLVRSARIRSTDSVQAFTLVGDTIDLFTTDKKLNRVFASHSASATNKDLVLNAERIDLRLKDQQIDEAYAFGPGRAKARTPQQNVDADSLRIVLTDQRPREVRAIGSAIALGVPDTLKIKSADRDMLRGDSVFAYFDTLQVPTDSAKQSRIREIRAFGNASSLFQIPSAKGPTAPPALNYVRGQQIFVQFDTGSVRNVRVDSSASGLYLEPAPDSLTDTSTTPPPSKPPTKRPPVSMRSRRAGPVDANRHEPSAPQPLHPLQPFRSTLVAVSTTFHRRLHA
jgi:lipopolysaccharide export system protein LptA